MTYEAILADQKLRDERDATRSVGPLRPAEDAAVIYTDGKSREQVIDELLVGEFHVLLHPEVGHLRPQDDDLVQAVSDWRVRSITCCSDSSLYWPG